MLELLGTLPEVDFAFGYGSGVLEQEGYSQSLKSAHDLPMLDLVLGVKKPREWHEINLERNREHYSGFARLIGPRGIAGVQEGFGARLYYNAMVPIPTPPHRGRLMKYGVISLDHLKTDLSDWTWLYAAGRMHKPVQIVRGERDLAPFARENLTNAVRAALLLLPEAFSTQELFLAIAGLSYTGDVRMRFLENQNKVHNIVAKATGRFQDLYAPILSSFKGLTRAGDSSKAYWQDTSPSAHAKLADALPSAVRSLLTADSAGMFGQQKVLPHGAATPMARRVSSALAHVVARSSRWQGAKGLLTAGVAKSAVYTMAKVTKAAAGSRRPHGP
ncbi:unnamed protein product [Choristocarpus tenellus]